MWTDTPGCEDQTLSPSPGSSATIKRDFIGHRQRFLLGGGEINTLPAVNQARRIEPERETNGSGN